MVTLYSKMIRILLLNILIIGSSCQSTLLQVHVLFRHGDRTPDRFSMYPNDPHLNDTFYPEGLGALTSLGKFQEYNIGRELRSRYNNFLGDIYQPDLMDAWSTAYNRTKMSLQLALAGLWPPAPIQIWNPELIWQPIPFNYLEMQNDPIMKFPLNSCPTYKNEYDRVSRLEEYVAWWKNSSNLIEYISENSGLKINTFLDLYVLYFGLYAEENTGRELPKWTQKVYPEFLEESVILFYLLQSHTDLQKCYTGGPLLKKIIDDATAKVNNTLLPENRKIFLYSGHEYNIAYILSTLNIFKLHIPPYASYILIEFYKIDDIYGFKIFYQDYTEKTPQLLTIPGCKSFCPFETFKDLTQNVILSYACN